MHCSFSPASLDIVRDFARLDAALKRLAMRAYALRRVKAYITLSYSCCLDPVARDNTAMHWTRLSAKVS